MITITYSLIEDIKSLGITLGRCFWLWKNHYIYHLSPFGLSHNLSLSEFANNTLASLPPHIHDISPEPITVYLVHFGTYGSYQYPNTIILSLHQRPEKAAQTLIHELAHLLTEKEVKLKMLSHDEKEKLAEKREKIIQNN